MFERDPWRIFANYQEVLLGRRNFKSYALSVLRLGLLIIIVVLIRLQSDWLAEQNHPRITLRQAGKYFPKTRRLEVHDPATGVQVVVDHRGDTQGGLLTTSPRTDDIIGYSGPNNVLVALDPQGTIVGVELLSSGDTPEHVAKVRGATNFLQSFKGWRPSERSAPAVEAVSGATLTSMAIAESVRQRLGVGGLSLRFPEPLTLEEVKTLIPTAHHLDASSTQVLGPTNQVIATLERTSPQADNVSGYRGPSECLLIFGGDGNRVTDFVIRKSYDTGSYVDQVRRSEEFKKLFLGKTRQELAALEYPRNQPDGISGATRTARAVVEGTRQHFESASARAARAHQWKIGPHDWALAAIIVGAGVISFTSLRRRWWIRVGWQLLLVGYVGLINHDLLSLALFGGWSSHGLPWKTVPGLVLLAGAALIVPFTTRHQLYCHQLCPHGAAQQLLGRLSRRRWMMPPRLTSWLERIPLLLLFAALLILLVGSPVSLVHFEAFDAWSLGAVGTIAMVIAIVGLVASLFVPQAYCRFGCPTGALLSLVRACGISRAWGSRDWVAVGLFSCALMTIMIVRAGPSAHREPPPETLRGKTMGTTWSVKIRDEIAVPEVLEAAIAKEFEWAESLTSNWRTNTTLSEFNRFHSTNAMAVPWAVLTLARWSREISEVTDGAFDITVAPLVRLWGFGPNARTNLPPPQVDIDAALPAVGWRKLALLDGMLAKQNPDLEVDLSSIAKGWAVDKVVDLLVFRGYTNFLVEAGGELRASDKWNVGIEHPDRLCTLRDEAIATSGTYRQTYEKTGRNFSHLIDPRTGRPVTHQTVSVSVRYPDCGHADAWATALNVLGAEAGLPLAERLNLAAQFVVEEKGGKLTVRQTSAWSAQETKAIAAPTR